MNRVLWWLPRVLAAGLIVFMSVFALDVFGEPNWPVALFMHLIPSFILSGALAISWWKPKVGGGVFVGLGLVAAVFFHSAWIGLPIVVVGGLFLYDGRNEAEKKRAVARAN